MKFAYSHTSHPLVILLACIVLSGPAVAADKADVRTRWHTPYDLYLTPQEAHAMKTANPDGVLFIDVRTIAEIEFTGFTDVVDANIPLYLFSADRWVNKRDGTHGYYRKQRNKDFVAAVDRLLAERALDRNAPIILMCTSGARAPAAARELHKAGFGQVYTQYQGFEGVKAKSGPQSGKRVVNGWKNAGLPWSYKLRKSKMYFNFAPPPPDKQIPKTN